MASNWHGDQFGRYKLIERGDQKLAFFSWLEPAAHLPEMTSARGHQKRTRTRAGFGIIKNRLAKAKAKNALTVLATSLDYETALSNLPLKQIDILMIKSAYEKLSEPKMFESTLILQPGARGTHLGRLDIALDMDHHIKSFKHQ